VHPGESVHAAIERHARAHGVIVTDDEEGALVLTRAGAHRSPTKLALGRNVLSADAHFSHRDRYSLYVVKGQQGQRMITFSGQRLCLQPFHAIPSSDRPARCVARFVHRRDFAGASFHTATSVVHDAYVARHSARRN